MSGNLLIGTWKLVSFEYRSEDGEVTYPLGRDALGYLIYAPDGYMAASMMAANRPRFASADANRATIEEKAAAEDTYIAYCGPYEIRDEEGKVIHHAELSLRPNATGEDQERFFRLDGDRLTISSAPALRNGKLRSAHLIWERARPRHRQARPYARNAEDI